MQIDGAEINVGDEKLEIESYLWRVREHNLGNKRVTVRLRRGGGVDV